MPDQIEVVGIVLDVVLRDIKNVHLSVYPPNGKVRISAPLRMKFETISLFAISKLGWIRQQQKKLWAQDCGSTTYRKMGGPSKRQGQRILRSTDEDQVGELQPNCPYNPF